MAKSSTALTSKESANSEIALNKAMKEGFEIVQTGGITKWVNLKQFQEDPSIGQGKPVKGNGNFIEGRLVGRDEIPDEDVKEGIRFFYSILLTAPCPVNYKDESGASVEEIAPTGDIVAIGERSKLNMLREMAVDGGIYDLIIQPHSRIKIGGGHTMWTFNVAKNTVKAPAILNVQKPPF